MLIRYEAFPVWLVRRSLVCALLLLAVTGCSQVQITYYSEPEGATIVISGVNHGTSPVTLYYNPTKEHETAKNMSVQGGYAQWMSGAIARKEFFSIDLSGGRSFTYTFNRPHNAPNAEIDTNYANQLRAARLERRRQAEQRRQAEAQAEAQRKYQEERLRLERARIDAINRQTEAIRKQNTAVPIYQ
jgi:hypothetical protein